MTLTGFLSETSPYSFILFCFHLLIRQMSVQCYIRPWFYVLLKCYSADKFPGFLVPFSHPTRYQLSYYLTGRHNCLYSSSATFKRNQSPPFSKWEETLLHLSITSLKSFPVIPQGDWQICRFLSILSCQLDLLKAVLKYSKVWLCKWASEYWSSSPLLGK